jgi:hypothetical protein
MLHSFRLGASAPTERRERERFKLACPIRLYQAGRQLGESQTHDINCESFSCALPGISPSLVSGDVLDCEIDLTLRDRAPYAPSIQLRGQAMVLRLTPLENDDGVQLVCRLLCYSMI